MSQEAVSPRTFLLHNTHFQDNSCRFGYPPGTFSKQSNVTNVIRVSHQGSEKNMKRDTIQKKKLSWLLGESLGSYRSRAKNSWVYRQTHEAALRALYGQLSIQIVCPTSSYACYIIAHVLPTPSTQD